MLFPTRKVYSPLLICRWIPELALSFNSTNLKLVDTFRLRPVDALRKISTDNYMMGMEEIGVIAASKSREMPGAQAQLHELFKNAVQETQQGVSLGTDMIVAVGRKPPS